MYINSKYSVLIVGLGRMGMGYDFEKQSNNIILSHAKSFYLNDDFRLAGGVDLKKNNMDNFERKYKCKAFRSIKDALDLNKPDIVIVSSSTDNHFLNIKEIIKFGKPKMIICEKPLSFDINEALEISDLCKKKQIMLFVNFFRRVLPGNLEILSLIKSKEISTPFQGVCTYSKGLFNSSSHFIDFFQFLFGDVKKVKIINKNEIDKDPEPDFELQFEEGNIIFLANKNKCVFVNSIELIMGNSKLIFQNGGDNVVWKKIEEDKRFSGYKVFGDTFKVLRNDCDRIQFYVANQISLAMKGKINFLCKSTEALKTQRILEQIKSKII